MNHEERSSSWQLLMLVISGWRLAPSVRRVVRAYKTFSSTSRDLKRRFGTTTSNSRDKVSSVNMKLALFTGCITVRIVPAGLPLDPILGFGGDVQGGGDFRSCAYLSMLSCGALPAAMTDFPGKVRPATVTIDPSMRAVTGDWFSMVRSRVTILSPPDGVTETTESPYWMPTWLLSGR